MRSYAPIPYESLPDDLRSAVREAFIRLHRPGDEKNLRSGWRNAALVYLLAMPQAAAEYGLEGVQTQLLYIVANLRYWRGADAKRLKEVFNRYEKELQG